MALRNCLILLAGFASACSSPFEHDFSHMGAIPDGVPARPRPIQRAANAAEKAPLQSIDDYIRHAMVHNPAAESAYQQWVAAAERIAQAGALPDPRLTIGFFLDEVETRTGPQQARVGLQQTLPWPRTLANRKDAEALAAKAAWHRFDAALLQVEAQLVKSLYELGFLDAAIAIEEENLELLRSFEQVIRARYRVGEGSHPELIRIQLEVAQLEDRLSAMRSSRPTFVAETNATLNRSPTEPILELPELPSLIASSPASELAQMALRSNPELLMLDQRIEEQRARTRIARDDAVPDLTVGLDYIVTDEAANSAIAESGDDPILLSFGINVPIWQTKYSAGVREAIARRLSTASLRQNRANQLASEIHRAWFQHTDAHRRVQLYETSLIPKAELSLRASLSGYRTGEVDLLDLFDTQRTLLEFALAGERAKADRAIALATLKTLAGEQIPTQSADSQDTPEVRP